MKKEKKEIQQVIELPKVERKGKSYPKDFDFLTEVLACMAWTTKA